MFETITIAIISVWLLIGIICYFVAENKNRNGTAWLIWGIILGGLALGYLLFDIED